MELGPRWAAVDMMAQIPNVISHFHSLLGWPSVCLGLEAGIRGVLWLTRAAVSTFSQSAAKESLEITLFSHNSASPTSGSPGYCWQKGRLYRFGIPSCNHLCLTMTLGKAPAPLEPLLPRNPPVCQPGSPSSSATSLAQVLSPTPSRPLEMSRQLPFAGATLGTGPRGCRPTSYPDCGFPVGGVTWQEPR